jgi:hypothetical protein
MDVPVVTLSNGVRVANFSSPHTFKFVDGTVLPACTPVRAQRLRLEAVETKLSHAKLPVTDVLLDWRLTGQVMTALGELERREDVDIILVPFPVMTAYKTYLFEQFGHDDVPNVGKMRVIRVADRVSKEIHIDRFCR